MADFEKRYPGDASDDNDNHRIYGCIKQFAVLKRKHRHLKVVLTIGGPSPAVTAKFAALSASPAGRANFVETSLAILRDCGFDGLDIHWEWPANKVEAANYTVLLGDLRHALDKYAESYSSSARFSLSVACPAATDQYMILDLNGMDRHVTFWNLLAYDYADSTSSTVTAHQSNVFTASNTAATPINPAQAVSDLLDADIEPSKVLLGCPLYGRGFANTEGMGKSFEGAPAGDLGHKEGIRDYKNLPLTGEDVKFDPASNAAYSYDSDKKELFSYDNPKSVELKANFILSQSLGGALFWEASGDRNGEGSLTSLMAKHLGGENYEGLDRSVNTVIYPGSKYADILGVEA